MDYKKLGLALVFTVVAIFNFLKNPLLIIGSWGTSTFKFSGHLCLFWGF